VFLDEPSTGMDPVARRFMWDFISETMSGRAVILTTHSMEECEALCDRIGIFSNGQLRCIGTSQHLKTRFGTGLQLDISTSDKDPEPAKKFITSTFPSAEEIEIIPPKLKYKLEEKNLRLSQIFSLIEKNKDNVNITDYSIGQTTLEQIFINFAKQGQQNRRSSWVGDDTEIYSGGASVIDEDSKEHKKKVYDDDEDEYRRELLGSESDITRDKKHRPIELRSDK